MNLFPPINGYTDTSPTDSSPRDSSPTGRFADTLVCRQDGSTTGQLTYKMKMKTLLTH